MNDIVPARPAHEKGGDADWTETFLSVLAETGNVTAAARMAGVNRDTPYGRRETDSAFAKAWASALEEACDVLELEARRRAYEGTKEPVFYQGYQCGVVKKYSDTLMIVLLKAHRPEKFREKFSAEHSGEIKVVVEYADGDPAYAPPAAPRPGDDPPLDGPV
ncbi:hypothetical protein [Paludisphaera mucosa]|uniref:Uncharacterized protein n=1 Tax=Paludisphaera mucosa TaxID=3030827 RepID=A0ABT6F6N1_9BACT|nr:hypothetical protein [Paludisphaera mucosa]MDG3003230.1 hypothetical protein [Paludisphaera mucosa]